MENEISNDYIENIINEIEDFFGIKEIVSSENIFSLISSNKIKEAIKLIAQQFGLPIDINITDVPKEYGAQNSNNQFQSTHLTKVGQSGSGVEGITAQVMIPSNLPSYGSSALNGYPINVKISDNCKEHPDAFTMIMAHELAHILLSSLNHPQKENEFYTDIIAITQGFQNVFKTGRKIIKTDTEHGFISTTIKTQTTTYGYLNDTQFNFVYNKINSILENHRVREKFLANKLKKFIKLLSKYKKTLFKCKQFLDFLKKNTNRKISEKDGKKIVSFFQPGYMEKIDLAIKKFQEEQKIIIDFLNECCLYTKKRLEQSSVYTKDIERSYGKLKDKFISLKKDHNILKKNVSYKYRVKVFFRAIKEFKKKLKNRGK